MALLIALGVSAATATIVGALIVGDSVRGSLRHLVVDRLGRIEFVVASPRYFSEDAVQRMGQAAEFPKTLDPLRHAFSFHDPVVIITSRVTSTELVRSMS